jgi:hypothetical protein
VTASPDRLRFFRSLDDRLEPRGYHRHTAFWNELAERSYLHPTAHRTVVRAGRGSIKSGTAIDFATVELVAVQWKVPPGERHYFAWVSENVEEAAQRPRQIEAKLRALGVPCTRTGNTVEIEGLPLGFKSFACRVGAVSGFRCIGFVCDEEAKWRNADDRPNAREVVASLRAMTITHPEAREWHLSSPWSKDDYHFEQIERGDSEHQIVACAPTWVANPSVTEADCRAKEPDERTFLREYAAIPSDAAFENWFGDAIDRARESAAMPGYLAGVTYTVALDQAFEADRFGFAVCSSQAGEWDNDRCVRGPRVTRAHRVGSWAPDRPPREMLRRVLDEVCVPFHTRTAHADQYAGPPLRQLAQDIGLRLVIVPWTSGSGEDSKGNRYRTVRTAMLEGAFRFPDDPDLIRELRSVRGVLSPSGNERIEIPRTVAGHGDRVSAMVLAGSIALAGPVQLAPSRMSWQEERQAEEREVYLQKLYSLF